ncbi:MAG: putative membrane protein [Alphaproteobacteria bacterium]|jgi:uncharacterized membrane protein
MVITTQNNNNTIITLSPNRSATWLQTKWVIAIMVFVVMTIAMAWSFAGAWIVLPFAGFEVGLFAYLMYRVSVYTHTQQIIHISPTQVNVEVGHRKKQTLAEMSREQIDVFYSESENNWELPRIALCTKDHKLEVGDFLNLDDRKKLKDALQSAGFIICRNKWWTA